MIGQNSHARHRGLGVNWVVDTNGQLIDCDSWSNFFHSVCWGNQTATYGMPASALSTTTNPTTGQLQLTLPSGSPATVAQTDCTQFWNALTDPSCSFSTYLTSSFFAPTAAIALAALGLVVILAMRK